MEDVETRSQALTEGLEALAPMFEADGFSLALRAVDGDHAVVTLHATPDACHDCLVPDEVLRAVVLDELRRRDAALCSVTVEKDFR